MHKELGSLIKTLTAIAQLTFIYLVVTWTSQLVQFIMGIF